MKLLLDMNLSPLWLETLQQAGFEVVHWSSIGQPNEADHKIMFNARQHGYTVCTQDLDFGLLLGTTQGVRPSVVQIRAQDVLPKSIGVRVIESLRQLEPELEAGAPVTIDPRKTRLRILPLKRN